MRGHPAQFAADLLKVLRTKPESINAMCRALRCDRCTLVRWLREFEEHGIVIRFRGDKGNSPGIYVLDRQWGGDGR